VSEKFGCKPVDDNTGMLIVYSTVQVAGGGTPGMVTNDSATS
jgi:hypothetical protein